MNRKPVVIAPDDEIKVLTRIKPRFPQLPLQSRGGNKPRGKRFKHFMPNEMDNMVYKYWKNRGDEKLFDISFEDAEKMIKDSTEPPTCVNIAGLTVSKDNRALALWVRNIEDKKQMTAKWIPFDKDYLPKANKTETSRVFKLDNYFFRAYRNEEERDKPEHNQNFKAYIRLGQHQGDVPREKLHIVGRIIKDENDEFGVIFIVGEKIEGKNKYRYFLDPPTEAGPEGDGGGTKLP